MFDRKTQVMRGHVYEPREQGHTCLSPTPTAITGFRCDLGRSQGHQHPISLLLFALILSTSTGIRSVSGFFSVPTEVIDVSTFNSITNIDNGTANALLKEDDGGDTDSSESFDGGESITAIKLRVFGGQDDPDVGRGLDFYGFPPPSSIQGVTTSPPQNAPCLDGALPGSNCSMFLGADNATAGPITIQIRSSLPTFRYRLVKTDITVPYAYLDHSAPILYCMPEHGPEGKDNICKDAPAQYVSYDTNLLLNGFQIGKKSDSDSFTTCRGKDNAVLGTQDWYNRNTQEDGITPKCTGCPITINQPLYVDAYTTTSHFCPFPVGHSIAVPTRDRGRFNGYQETGDNDQLPAGFRACDGKKSGGCDKRDIGFATSDLASLEDYYYWCFGNNVGTRSDLPGQKQTEPLTKKGIEKGSFFDMVTEYDTAYQCTLAKANVFPGGINTTGCAPYVNVHNALKNFPKAFHCNLGEETKSDDDDNQPCSNSVLAQVTAAIRFLTASCDAADSAENMSPSVYGSAEADPNGFFCPGSKWGHVRPNVFKQEGGLNLARCSAGCSDKNTVTHTTLTKGLFRDKWNPTHFAPQGILREKATIELGPVTCNVYRIQSRPRAVMDVAVVITAPDGIQTTQHLSTDGFDFATSDLNGVKFSSRINRIEPSGAMGPTLDGYIVICGTEDKVDLDPTSKDSKREMSTCDAFTDEEYNLDEQSVGACVTPSRGAIRGVFPRIDENTNTIVPGIPTINPWPDLIKKMAKDFQTECKKAGAGCTDDIGTLPPGFQLDDLIARKTKSCATPTPTYLSILNCGRRVSWYYVEENNVHNYGNECGRLGFRNVNAKTIGGAQFMCQQGDFTCTPGFGTPRYGTSAASTRVKSPCQEQGILTRFNQQTISDSGCAAGDTGRPLNLPPGWVWGPPLDTTPGGAPPSNDTAGEVPDSENPLLIGTPNMWVDGLYLYRQPSTNDGASIALEIEIYTNTFFGGSFQSFAPGNITDANPAYCKGTIDVDGSGLLSVQFCNLSPDFGGSFVGSTTCGFPESFNQAGTNAQGISVSMNGDPSTPIDLAAGACKWVQWSFGTSGPINRTQIYCVTQMWQGVAVGLASPISELEYSCDQDIVTFVDLGKHNAYSGSDFDRCPNSADLFCQLSGAPDWTQAIMYMMLLGLYITVVVYVFNLTKAAYETQEANKIIGKESLEILEQKMARKTEDHDRIVNAVREAAQPAKNP